MKLIHLIHQLFNVLTFVNPLAIIYRIFKILISVIEIKIIGFKRFVKLDSCPIHYNSLKLNRWIFYLFPT
jgi:hypothetical protein